MIGSFRPGKTVNATVHIVQGDKARRRRDVLATEEPMEIRLAADSQGGEPIPVAVTMRTPGNDFELAAGFLFTEGIVHEPGEIRQLTYCTDPAIDGSQLYNIVSVELCSDAGRNLHKLQRNFYVTSSCGICGKASLDAVLATCGPVGDGPLVSPAVIRSLPDRLREGQSLFDKTGGIHAAGIFDSSGRLLAIREDVGRHNAVDKVIGEAFLGHKLPLSDRILMVSGRTSFEIMQKAAMAGIPVVVAVSAPSSLAVETAERFNMTLVGFLRGERFNVYAGGERIQSPREELRVGVETFRAAPAGDTADRIDSRFPRGDDAVQSAIPMLSFVGHSGSGKTTLIAHVIAELAKKGLAVGTLKRSHHDLSFDRDGKDSAKLLQAGAVVSMAAGSNVAALTIPAWDLGDTDLGRIERLMREAAERLDLIIVEGHKRGPLPKVLALHPEEAEEGTPAELSNVIAIVSARSDERAHGGASDVPRFFREDPASLALWIMARLREDAFGGGDRR